MSATVDRPAAPAATEAPSPLERAQGLELLGDVSGSGYKDGASLARRADGQMVQLGPLLYGLLEGKSTLVKVISGIYTADEGQIFRRRDAGGSART